jgi:hypothetical protein
MEHVTTVRRNRLARSIAVAWLLMGLTSASLGAGWLRRLFMVANDPAATARNVVQRETLYRTVVAGDLVSLTLYLAMGLLAYELLGQIGRSTARTMLALVMVGAAVGFASDLLLLAPLTLLRGSTFGDLSPAQLQELAFVCLRVRTSGFTILTWFLGLWLVPFGLLLARSSYAPRVIGFLLAFAGGAHAAYALVAIALPAAAPAVFSFVTGPSGLIGELPALLWLLIRGTDSRADAAQ